MWRPILRRCMMTSGSVNKNKKKVSTSKNGIAIAKQHAKPSIISATIICVADGIGLAGGGFSAAVSMSMRASGLNHEDAVYSISLGLLPLCIGCTFMGLLDDDDTKKTKESEIAASKSDNRVCWPESLAFAATAIIVSKGARIINGLWSPLPPGGKLDSNLLRTHPLVRTASQGIFSFAIIGVGCASLLRSYEQYTVHEGVDDNDGDKPAYSDNGEEENDNTLHYPPAHEDEGLLECALRAKTILLQQIEEDMDRNVDHMRQFAVTGAATGLGVYLLGPTALSFPVLMLVYLCNDNVDDGRSQRTLSPRQALHTLFVGAIPYMLSNVIWFHRLGGRPRLKLFIPFAVGVGVVYGLAKSLVLPYAPEHTANAAFGLIALVGGGLKLVRSARALRKFL